MDEVGRKPTSIVMASVSVFGWALITSTSNLVPLCLGRLLTGMSHGLISVAANVYVVEISTEKLRGILGMIYNTMMTAGILIDLLVGPLLPWWYMALLGAAMSTSILLGTLVIPESPPKCAP